MANIEKYVKDRQVKCLLRAAYSSDSVRPYKLNVNEARKAYLKKTPIIPEIDSVFSVIHIPLPSQGCYKGAAITLIKKDTLPKKGIPTIFYLPGGGFVLKNEMFSENFCKLISHHLNAMVVYIQYPLAPEYKFPKPYESTLNLLKYIIKHSNNLGIPLEKVLLWGDSSGGNLAASMSYEMRGLIEIKCQLLNCPSLDYYNTYESKEIFNYGFLLDTEFREWLAKNYLNNDAERQDKRVSPLLRKNSVSPATIIIAAECDPLRDESIAYSRMLEKNNIATELLLFKNMPHCFSCYIKYIPSAKSNFQKIINLLQSKYLNK